MGKIDIIPNALNEIMNVKKKGRDTCIVKPASKLLIEIFNIMKEHGYIDYKIEKDKFEKIAVKIKKLNECKAIKPRFYVKAGGIEKYARRFLPARNFGIMIVSTNKGLVTGEEMENKKIGGCLIAYCS